LLVLGILRRVGARVAVVLHEPARQTQSRRRWIDRFRGACQDWVIHRLYKGASKCIFADPLKTIDWLPNDTKSAFIPIGANIPAIPFQLSHSEQTDTAKSVVIFGVTDYGEQPQRWELGEIAHAVRAATVHRVDVKLLFIGRGTSQAGEAIRHAMHGIPAEVRILGLLSAERIAESLATSDVMLFVRGKIHPRRGTVIAGIACGLPIVGYAGMAEGTPLMEAGLELAPFGDRDALGAALSRILTDASLRRALRQRSVCAYQKYFSWDTIAGSYIRFLEEEVKGANDKA
jgi:phosphatidylinositol alpha-mannosyltransferase